MPTPIETWALALALLLAFGVAAVAPTIKSDKANRAGSLEAAPSCSAIIRPTARASPPIAARNRAPACKNNEPWMEVVHVKGLEIFHRVVPCHWLDLPT